MERQGPNADFSDPNLTSFVPLLFCLTSSQLLICQVVISSFYTFVKKTQYDDDKILQTLKLCTNVSYHCMCLWSLIEHPFSPKIRHFLKLPDL